MVTNPKKQKSLSFKKLFSFAEEMDLTNGERAVIVRFIMFVMKNYRK